MALLFTMVTASVGWVTLLLINVNPAVVFTDKFVKVLLLMFVFNVVAALIIKVIAAVPATVCPNVLKSLLLIFNVVVALTVVASLDIPNIVPPATALRKDTVLLLIVFTITPVGALLKAGTKIPLRVPAVTPPFELATLL